MRKHFQKNPKARNLDVPAMMHKKAGAHGKTRKAQRRAEKIAFQKERYD